MGNAEGGTRTPMSKFAHMALNHACLPNSTTSANGTKPINVKNFLTKSLFITEGYFFFSALGGVVFSLVWASCLTSSGGFISSPVFLVSGA
jgi:hypothetical protein